MDKICGSVSDIDSQCQDLVKQFQDEYKSYEEKQDIIFNSNLRFRKGLINGLGTVAKYLLGTLDAEDAEYYNNQITSLQNNDQHVLNLIKNQTTLVDSTIKLIRVDRDQILSNFKVLGLKLDNLSNQINRVHDEVSKNIIATRLNTIAISNSMIMYKFSKTQEDIISLMNEIKQGHPNPSVIPEMILNNQLDAIRQNLPTNLMLPFTGHKASFNDYLSVMKIDTTIHSDKLFIRLTIPLLTREIYTIFKIIPIPTPQFGYFTFINPSMKYIALDASRNSYYPITKEDITECIHTKFEKSICIQTKPIYSTHEGNRICEMQLLNHATALPKNCETRVIEPYRFYIKLSQPNKWIFVMDRPYLVDISCKAHSYTYTLSGSGIFQLKSGCSFKNGDIHIESNNHHASSNNLSYTPPMNLSHFSTSSPDFYSKHLKLNKTHINSFNAMNLKQLSTDLESLKREEIFQKTLKTRDLKQNILTFTIIPIFIVGILCWTYRTTIIEKLRKPKNPIAPPHATTSAVFNDNQHAI